MQCVGKVLGQTPFNARSVCLFFLNLHAKFDRDMCYKTFCRRRKTHTLLSAYSGTTMLISVLTY